MAGKKCNGFVVLFMQCRYGAIVTQHCVLAQLVMRPWGMGRTSPADERGTVAGGLCPSARLTLAMLAVYLPGAAMREGSPRAAEAVVGASFPKPTPGAHWGQYALAPWTPEGSGSAFPGRKRAVRHHGWGGTAGREEHAMHSQLL